VKNDTRRQGDALTLLKKTFFVAFRQVTAMAMGFGSSMLLAKNLGSDGNGEFVTICVMVSALVSFTSMGAGNFPNFAVGRFSDVDLQRNMLRLAAVCTVFSIPLVFALCSWCMRLRCCWCFF
jgi:O-antigen/teichoic acid export membrane protein